MSKIDINIEQVSDSLKRQVQAVVTGTLKVKTIPTFGEFLAFSITNLLPVAVVQGLWLEGHQA